MARMEFYASATRVASGVALAAGATYVVYSDSAGTVLADISATSGGASISGSTKAADANGVLTFWGPTDATNTLYLRCPALPFGVQRIDALADARLDALDTKLGLPILPSGVAAWYAADQITGLADGAAVATWSDLSGNARDLIQATSGNRPTYQTSEQNGLPVVRFDDTDDYLRCTAGTWGTALAQPNTIFVVAEVSNTGVLFDGPGGGAGRHLLYWTSSTNAGFFAGSQVDITQALPVAMSVYSWKLDGASSVIRRNGNQIGTGNVGSQTMGGLTVGADQGGASPVGADVAELVVFDRALNAHEVQQVEDYLTSKWALGGALARKPVSNDMVRFVSPVGSDSNDGLSWGSAKLTIMGAYNSFSGNGTIYVAAGTFAEAVIIDRSGVSIIGSGNGLSAGTTIQAPDNSSDALKLQTGSGAGVYQNFCLSGFSTSWTAILLYLSHSSNNSFNDIILRNPDNAGTDTTGGTGIKMDNAEGNVFTRCFVQEAGLGLHLVSEATENVFIGLKGAANYLEVLIEGNCGGNVFLFTKWTANKTSSAFQVDIGGGGGNTFIGADWSEGAAANKSRVTSDRNHFVSGVSSPQNTMTVSGDGNLFEGWKILKTMDVTGDDNVLRRVWLQGTSLVNSGARTIIDRPYAEIGSITYAGALATPYRVTGAALATNATSGFLYIPTCAGTPSGTPVAETGMVPLIFDTTNNKLYIYDGSWLGGTAPGAFS